MARNTVQNVTPRLRSASGRNVLKTDVGDVF